MTDDSPLQFPCRFSIKAMGKSGLELDITVIEIVRRHSPGINEGAVSIRPSKDGNYIAVTVVIDAHSRQQLDAIYQDLSDHPQVLMVL